MTCSSRACRATLDPVSVAERDARFCSSRCRSAEAKARKAERLSELRAKLAEIHSGIFRAAALAGLDDVESLALDAEATLRELAELAPIR